jgi:plastocyanin
VNDGGRHQIVADEGVWTSPLLTTAQERFEHRLSQPGVFPYHCAIHGGPGGQGMAGVVTVVEHTP